MFEKACGAVVERGRGILSKACGVASKQVILGDLMFESKRGEKGWKRGRRRGWEGKGDTDKKKEREEKGEKRRGDRSTW